MLPIRCSQPACRNMDHSTDSGGALWYDGRPSRHAVPRGPVTACPVGTRCSGLLVTSSCGIAAYRS